MVWLAWAGVEVVALNLKFMVQHPGDEKYLQYLSRVFPEITFIQEPDTQEINKIMAGIYQSPIKILKDIHHWEHIELSFDQLVEEMRVKHNCDYTCWGQSKYESVARASNFYNKGLMQGTKIFPLGLMDKKQVLDIAKTVKLHPCYKTSKGTLDFPSWYKMRASMILNPEYYDKMCEIFPLFELDKYRYEVLLEKE